MHSSYMCFCVDMHLNHVVPLYSWQLTSATWVMPTDTFTNAQTATHFMHTITHVYT